MTDKEINMAILDELYNIASGVWSLMEKNITGSFTAREVCRMIDKGIFWGENNLNELHKINVGKFICEIPTKHIFKFVATFEGLAKIGNNRKMFKFKTKDEAVGAVTFWLDKSARELCSFVDNNTNVDFSPLNYVFIDSGRKCLVATNGHRMLVRNVIVSQCEGDIGTMLIDPKVLKKMCARMKKGIAYQMTAKNVKVNADINTVVEFERLMSSVSCLCRYPNWRGCVPKVSEHLSLNFGTEWEKMRAFADVTSDEVIVMSGKRGEKFVTLTDNKNKLIVETETMKNEMNVAIGSTLKYSFEVGFKTSAIIAALHVENFYLGRTGSHPMAATNHNGMAYVIMPDKKDGYVGEWIADGVLEEPRVDCNMSLLPIVEIYEKKNYTSKPSNPRKVDGSRKFTFEAIGVKPGDKLTFVDGTDVTAVDGTKVEYMGKVYTLSGFCKTFMLENKRNKANSYRGCAFFYRDGVKLEKLFKDVLKAAESTMDNPAPASVSTDVPTTAKQEGITPSDREANVAEPMAETRRQADADIYAPILAHGLRSNLSLLLRAPTSLRRPTTIPLRHNKAFTRLIWRRGGLRHDRRVAVAPDARITGVQDATVHTLPLPPPPAMI